MWHFAQRDVSPTPRFRPPAHLLPCPVFPLGFLFIAPVSERSATFHKHVWAKRSTIIQRMASLGRHWGVLQAVLIFSQQHSCEGTALAVQWFRLCLPMQGVQVRALVKELRSHTPLGHKTKTLNRIVLQPWRRLLLGRKAVMNLDSILKGRDITLLTKVCIIKAMIFSNSHIHMWNLDPKEGWAPKNWCIQIVFLKKTRESVGLQGDQTHSI